MPRILAALGFVAALIAFASGAEAASQKTINLCGAGDDLDASIKACTQIINGKETKQNKAMAFYNRAWAYRQKGDYDSAIADDTRAIELDPKNAHAFIDRGNTYYQKREYDLSIADSTRGIELSPKAAEPYVNRGAAFSEKGDLDRALADFDRAIELKPKSAAAFSNRGYVYIKKGDYDLAITDLTRAIELDPKSALSFSSRGLAYNEKGEHDRAITDLNHAIELDPKLANVYRHRGVVYLKTGKLGLARVDLDKALELKPDYPEARATLAELEQAEASAKGGVAASSPAAAQSPTAPATPTVETAVASPQALALPLATVPLGKRVALVIGNATYAHTAALGNPDNDAADVAAALQRLGFTVIFEHDLDKRGMDDTFRRFAREVKGADVALFYYAGHAMQFEGVNYLMPVDAKLADEADVPYEMAKLDDVVADMARMSGVRIAVLDACRNNPLEEQLKRSVASTRGVSPTRGLARIARPEGLIVAYSTQSGNVAEDGSGRNSPFTAALLQHIETPGLEVGTLFRRVMGSVKQATSGKQHPELSVLFDGEFYFKPGS